MLYMDKISILNDIKKHYGFRKNKEFANFLGISPQTLSNWKARNTYDPVLIYNKCKDINPDWLLTGTGNICKVYPKDLVDNINASEPSTSYALDKTEIPIYNLDSGISLHDLCNNKTQWTKILKFVRIPGISDFDAACYVLDNSMSPIVKAGDIIIFKNITLKETLSGKMYLIETEKIINNKVHKLFEIRIFEKFIPERQVFVFQTKNTFNKTTELNFNEIISIAHIQASICFN